MDAPTLLNLLRRSSDYLVQRGIENGRREAEWLFCQVLQLTRLDLYTRFDMLIDEADIVSLRQLVQRRGRREPLAYLLGTQPFADLQLAVGPGVLVPRPETEDLVDLVVSDLQDMGERGIAPLRVIDVGTGSGAIALALKQRNPSWQVEGVDLSAEALAQAAANAVSCQLDVSFSASDLLDAAPGPWHAIVANLPYIGEDERDRCDPELAYEPALALFSGADGLDHIRRLVAQLPSQLAGGAVCWLEHGDRQGSAVSALCQGHDLAYAGHSDRFGRLRFARITQAEHERGSVRAGHEVEN